MLKDTIEYVLKSLAAKPESIVVKEVSDGQKYTIIVKADSEDIGKVIGKDGKTIRALRTIVTLFGPPESEKMLDIEQ